MHSNTITYNLSIKQSVQLYKAKTMQLLESKKSEEDERNDCSTRLHVIVGFGWPIPSHGNLTSLLTVC